MAILAGSTRVALGQPLPGAAGRRASLVLARAPSGAPSATLGHRRAAALPPAGALPAGSRRAQKASPRLPPGRPGALGAATARPAAPVVGDVTLPAPDTLRESGEPGGAAGAEAAVEDSPGGAPRDEGEVVDRSSTSLADPPSASPPPPEPGGRRSEGESTAAGGRGGEGESAAAGAPATALTAATGRRSTLASQWRALMRWSRWLKERRARRESSKLRKVAVFGGGSFGTAVGVALARAHPEVQVVLLVRSDAHARAIEESRENARYLPGHRLPDNVRATASAEDACAKIQFALHAVPAQATRAFLRRVKLLLPRRTPIVSLTKGLEVSTSQTMREVIASELGSRWPAAFLSGPSFAAEIMEGRPTGVVVASTRKALARQVQHLLASPSFRVSATKDVVGVEVCGALKNVLAIAAGIVQGLGLGDNAMAALVAQGCSEIRWLAARMGAKAETIAGLSGVGDIMLTCYGKKSRNRAVGEALGAGTPLREALAGGKGGPAPTATWAAATTPSFAPGDGPGDPPTGGPPAGGAAALATAPAAPLRAPVTALAASAPSPPAGGQVAEGVATSRAVLALARQHRVQLPVLCAVAQVLDGAISPREAVEAVMELPQVEER